MLTLGAWILWIANYMPLCWLQVGLNHENAFPSILELEGQKGVSVISPSLADGCVLMLLFLCVFISGISYFLLFLAGWGGWGVGGAVSHAAFCFLLAFCSEIISCWLWGPYEIKLGFEPGPATCKISTLPSYPISQSHYFLLRRIVIQLDWSPLLWLHWTLMIFFKSLSSDALTLGLGIQHRDFEKM